VWTRVTINDLGDGGSVPRDEEVTVVDVAMHYKGSVTIQTQAEEPHRAGPRHRTPALGGENRPADGGALLVRRSIIRHVDFIRKYGKKTAQAIANHELFRT
jgi:hypothetical protein